MFAKDFRRNAWSALTGKWGTFVLVSLIAALIGGACGGTSFIGVGAIVAVLIAGPLNLGLSECYLKLVRGQNVEIVNMFDGFKNFLKGFLLQLINGLFIALWSLLFIIPGIIKSYSYSMSFYILADNPEIDCNVARERSIELMRGNKWRLFCLDLSFIGWYLLSLLTLGILFLWVEPYHNAARAVFYRRILDEKHGIINAQNYSRQPDFDNNGGSVFGSDYGTGNGSADSNDPYPEFNGDSRDDDTFTKGNGGESPLNADEL